MEKTIIEQKETGLHAFWCSTPQFKTARLTVNLVLPLVSAETSSVRAMVPSLISRVTREYPDYSTFGRRLQELYGASLHSSVSSIGDNQVLTLSASGIANRYAYDGENIQRLLADILESILFTPLVGADGLFPEDGFLQEQRQLIETLEAEFNEKRIYAKNRCTELLFANEPAGVPRIGFRETLAAVQRADVNRAWEYLMQNAKAFQFFIGDGADGSFAERFGKRLGDRNTLSTASAPHTARSSVQRVTEEMPLAQSKLVMGFGLNSDPKKKLANRMLAIVFGGTPSSKLFLNVREKQSLCYYCSSRYEGMKNVIFVESGVETKNLERTEEAVLAELAAIQRGELSDEELLHAKLAVKNSCNAVADSAHALESWYFGRMMTDELQTPEDYAEDVMKITKEDIVEAAQHAVLDTVYQLRGCAE